MSTTDDAALVAELRRLNGGLDAEWGDDEAFDTLKTKLWLHRTRLLDLAEEAIRLRSMLLPDIIEQFAPETIAKGLRDATEPAPKMRCHKEPHKQRGGYLHAEDDDTPYDVDGLRYCGRCHHFLGECESRRASAAPIATPTPDIDPEEVRRALGEYFAGAQYSEFAVEKIVAAAREWLRLREQPEPDVQAQIDAAYERGVADGLRKARS